MATDLINQTEVIKPLKNLKGQDPENSRVDEQVEVLEEWCT